MPEPALDFVSMPASGEETDFAEPLEFEPAGYAAAAGSAPVQEPAPPAAPPDMAQQVEAQPIPPATAPSAFAPGYTEPQQPMRDPFGPSSGELRDQQTAAAAAAPRPFFEDNLAPIVKTWNWFGTMALWVCPPLLLAILGSISVFFLESGYLISLGTMLLAGLYELIFPFVMAFNKRVNPNKQNFFRANLLWMLFLIILVVICMILLLFLGQGLIENYGMELLSDYGYYF